MLQAGFHEAVMLLFQLALVQVLACFAAAFAGLPLLFFPKGEAVADGGRHLAGVDGVQPCGQLFQRQAEHTPLFAVVGNRHYFSDG